MMYEIVPEVALADPTVNTRTRDRELAQKLAAQESEHYKVPHTVQEVHHA